MRRGIRIPAWSLLLVAVLGILSGCQGLRDLERFAIRHHAVPTEALGLELRRPPSDSAFRHFFRQVDVAALCTAIRDWTMLRSQVVQRISISLCATARRCGARSSPPPVADPRSLPR